MQNTRTSTDPNGIANIENTTQQSLGESNGTPMQDTCNSIHPNDIGNFVGGERLPKDVIKNLLQALWTPNKTYLFPWVYSSNGDRRRFRYKWLEDFPFLSYSALPGKEGGFCRYCVLMGKVTGGRGDQHLSKFVIEPFTNYKKGNELLKEHQDNKYHKFAMAQVDILRTNPMAIDEMLYTQARESSEKLKSEGQEYRRRARDVIETVMTLAQQEVSLRGHRDHGPLDLESIPGPGKEGNLKAFLRYRALGDKQLYENIQNAPKNMTLTSPKIQNQIIQVCGDAIKESLLKDIKEAGIYSIIADCTADISRKEQLALAIRYVTKDGDMREDLVGLLVPNATTGVALAGDITNGLTNLGLSLCNCRGQAYDGCGNMSGHINGCQAIIKRNNPLAIYTHCQSHKLNLALGRVLATNGVKQMLATLSQVSDFVSGSPGRLELLEKNVEQCLPDSLKKRIKPLCRVRWVEQHESVMTFRHLLKPILMTLDDIIEKGNNKAVSRAEGFLLHLTQFQFIVSLEMAVVLFGITKPLSVKLQRPNQTFGKAMQLVKNAIRVVESNKGKFNEVMEKATHLAGELDIPVLLPRGRTGKKRDTIEPVDFYRTERWEPFISEMVQQLKDRFPEDHPAFQLQEILPPHIVDLKSEKVDETFNSIVKAAEVYQDDLPCIDSLQSELALWRDKISREIPKDPEYGFQMKEVFQLTDDYPNVHAIVKLLMTMPATSCTAERAFSTLKRVKTAQRSTMGEERLEALILTSMYGQERLSVDKVLDDFIKLRPRRVKELNA